MIRDFKNDAQHRELRSAVNAKRQDLFTASVGAGALNSRSAHKQSTMFAKNNGFVRSATVAPGKVVRAQSTGIRMLAYPGNYSFAPTTLGSFMKRTNSIARDRVFMQATESTIDVEVVNQTSVEKKAYNPKMFENKYVKKSDIQKNPLYNLASIGLEAKNGKVPQIESFQELITNSNEFLKDRIDKVRDDPKYWIQQGVRTGFYVNAGLLAARKQKLNLFKPNEDDTDEQKMEFKKQKFEEYITALTDYEALYELEAENIKQSYYKMPFTTELGHRDLNPAWNRMKA